METGAALGQVCDYIHLNPVRAGAVPAERLEEYRHSSYWFLRRPRQRPAFLHPETALAEAGGLRNDGAGWRAYADYLAWQAEAGPAGKSRAYVSLSRGWALGSREFKRGLIADHKLAAEARAWEHEGAREIRAAGWEEALKRAFRVLGRTEEDLAQGPRAAPWKVAMAAYLKESTQASNPWLAQRLGFGRPMYVSRLVSALRRQPLPTPELSTLRAKCTA